MHSTLLPWLRELLAGESRSYMHLSAVRLIIASSLAGALSFRLPTLVVEGCRAGCAEWFRSATIDFELEMRLYWEFPWVPWELESLG